MYFVRYLFKYEFTAGIQTFRKDAWGAKEKRKLPYEHPHTSVYKKNGLRDEILPPHGSC